MHLLRNRHWIAVFHLYTSIVWSCTSHFVTLLVATEYDTGLSPDAPPPILVADQSGMVHAFSSQIVGDDESYKAITYNQWTLENGWTDPNDVVLSPVKNEARILDVFLDSHGMFHLIFFGGDEADAQIYYVQAPIAHAHEAPAWSVPVLVGEAAHNPQSGALAADDQGNLAIIYSGQDEGLGLYTLYSSDRGESWTEPEPTFLTYSEQLFPFTVKLWPGRIGFDSYDLGCEKQSRPG